jgi:ubiquinone/menaquinone biosynthesis C-methylase UbiE
VDADATSHYDEGVELDRLDTWGRLEFERTKELLARVLPPAPARVLDVGGGPGAYAEWLAGLGHDVHLVDPVPLHVERAAQRAQRGGRSFTASVGDARSLAEEDASVEVVLLLGPLYHLTEAENRAAALAEARRVLVDGGLVAAAAVSRFASLLDGFSRGAMADPAFAAVVETDLRTGQHRNPERRPGWFTTAYFHRPDELAAELDAAGFALDGVWGVEGPAAWSAAARGESDAELGRLAAAARAVESEPSLLGASAHLLAVGRKPAGGGAYTPAR